MVKFLKQFFGYDAKPKTPDSIKILQLQCNPEIIDRLRHRAGHSNDTELLNSALSMYGWALDAIEAGRIVASVNELDSNYRELSMPPLEKLKKQIPWGTWES